MVQDKRKNLYKYIFLISTVSGVLGVYALYKQMIVFGWVLVGIWAVFATIVRVLIISDRKKGD
jgi:hypothetical protein